MHVPTLILKARHLDGLISQSMDGDASGFLEVCDLLKKIDLLSFHLCMCVSCLVILLVVSSAHTHIFLLTISLSFKGI